MDDADDDDEYPKWVILLAITQHNLNCGLLQSEGIALRPTFEWLGAR
jgi:hypothetical protein